MLRKGGTRVNEGADRGSQKEIRGNRDHKGVWVVKSRCIELWLCRCTSEFNTVLSQCEDKRTAHGFFLTLSQTWLWRSYP